MDNIDIISIIEDVQLYFDDVIRSFAYVGSKGNSAICFPNAESSPLSSRASNAYNSSKALITFVNRWFVMLHAGREGRSMYSKFTMSFTPDAFNSRITDDRFTLLISGSDSCNSVLNEDSVYNL